MTSALTRLGVLVLALVLVGFLVPELIDRSGSEAARAQSATGIKRHEIIVFSGLSNSLDVEWYHNKDGGSDETHTGGLYGIDLSERIWHTNAHADAAEVRFITRTISSPNQLWAIAKRLTTGKCTGISVEVFYYADDFSTHGQPRVPVVVDVVTINYIHINATISLRTAWKLPKKDSANPNASKLLGDILISESQDCVNAGYWDGNHLHQELKRIKGQPFPLNAYASARPGEMNNAIPIVPHDVDDVAFDASTWLMNPRVCTRPNPVANVGDTPVACPRYALMVTEQPDAGGTTDLTADEDVRGETDDGGPYLVGTEVVIDASAKESHEFRRWEDGSGEAGGCDSTSFEETIIGRVEKCTVEMDRDRTVVATFVQIFGLTVKKTATGGTASCVLTGTTTDCPDEVRGGTGITVSATEAEGYRFDHWTIVTTGGVGASGTSEETSEDNPLITAVTADTTVTPVFERSTKPAVTITAGASPVTEGTGASFTVTRTGSTATALSVTVSVSETGAMISGTAPSSVTISATEASATLTVATTNDSADESNSVITATVTAAADAVYRAGNPSSASVTVRDNDGTVTYSWSASCGTASGNGSGYATQALANQARAAWLAANCKTCEDGTVVAQVDACPVYSWSASCGTASGSGTAATQTKADTAKADWIAANCKTCEDNSVVAKVDACPTTPPPITWSASCGTASGSGTAATQAQADAAKAAWITANCKTCEDNSVVAKVDACPTTPPPITWSASCGTASGSGTAATQAQADAAKAAWIAANCKTCEDGTVVAKVDVCPVYSWSASCGTASGSGTAATQTKADAAKAAWIAANCKTCEDGSVVAKVDDCPKYPWSASCGSKSGSGTAATQAKADIAKAAWIRDNCTWGWSASCNGSPATNSDSGYSTQAAAASAGASWVNANCPKGGVTVNVTPNTKWYATVTCDNGTSFTLGPYGSSSAASSAGQGGLLACAAGGAGLSLPVSGTVTLKELEEAVQTALTASGSSLTLEDLKAAMPVSGQAEDAPPSRAGSFVTSVEEDGQYASLTCDDGRAFTVGPAATLREALDAGSFGLRVCANAGPLAGLVLPETSAVTRAWLEAAVTAALAALPVPQTIGDLQAPPSGEGVDGASDEDVEGQASAYRVWSTTTWGWSGSCNIGAKSGSGAGFSTETAAGNAAFAWAATANCPAGGGSVDTSRD